MRRRIEMRYELSRIQGAKLYLNATRSLDLGNLCVWCMSRDFCSDHMLSLCPSFLSHASPSMKWSRNFNILVLSYIFHDASHIDKLHYYPLLAYVCWALYWNTSHSRCGARAGMLSFPKMFTWNQSACC